MKETNLRSYGWLKNKVFSMDPAGKFIEYWLYQIIALPNASALIRSIIWSGGWVNRVSDFMHSRRLAGLQTSVNQRAWTKRAFMFWKAFWGRFLLKAHISLF